MASIKGPRSPKGSEPSNLGGLAVADTRPRGPLSIPALVFCIQEKQHPKYHHGDRRECGGGRFGLGSETRRPSHLPKHTQAMTSRRAYIRLEAAQIEGQDECGGQGNVPFIPTNPLWSSETWAGGQKVGADPCRLVIYGACQLPGGMPMAAQRTGGSENKGPLCFGASSATSSGPKSRFAFAGPVLWGNRVKKSRNWRVSGVFDQHHGKYGYGCHGAWGFGALSLPTEMSFLGRLASRWHHAYRRLLQSQAPPRDGPNELHWLFFSDPFCSLEAQTCWVPLPRPHKRATWTV